MESLNERRTHPRTVSYKKCTDAVGRKKLKKNGIKILVINCKRIHYWGSMLGTLFVMLVKGKFEWTL